MDDNNANLTACKNILKPHYEVYPAPTVDKMFDLLKHIMPDLILLDVNMPDINGYEAAGRLKKDDDYKDIPVIFLSGRVDPKSEMFGLNMGALDYIHKPFVSELLLRRLEIHLALIDSRKILEKQNKVFYEIRAPLNEILDMLDTVTEADDPSKIKECLTKVNGASRELLVLINNTLDVS